MPFWTGGAVSLAEMMVAQRTLFADAFPPQNVHHHFIGQDTARGVYAKELHIPAGFDLVSHSHPYDHLSILASGSVFWKADGAKTVLLIGPCAVTVKAGVAHSLHARTAAVWFCIHPTDETDSELIDAAILSKG